MRRWLALGAVVLVALAAALAWQLRGDGDPPVERATPGSAAPAPPPAPPALRPDPAAKLAALEGTVRDRTGAPIASALVCLIERVATQCVSTDRDGHYAFATVPATTLAVAASAAKLRPVTEALDRHAGETTIDLVLTSAGVLVRGRVMSLEGAPIAKARVTAPGMRLETSATGTFELWAAPGRVNLRVLAAGYAESARWVSAPSTIEIVLVPESSIAGTVVDDATGTPLANVRVGFATEAGEMITDRGGAFRIGNLAPGRYQLGATTPRSFGATFEIALGIGQHRSGVLIRMRPAHQVSVKIINPDGSPCAGDAWLDQWGSPIGTPWRDGAITRIDGVPSGRYTVGARCAADHPPARVIDVKGDAEVVVRAVEPGSGILRGRLVSDRTAENLRVWIRSAQMVSRMVNVDEAGEFSISLAPGRYTIVAGGWKPETAEEQVDVTAGAIVERTLSVPVSAFGRLIVSIVDRDRHPLPYTPFSVHSKTFHSAMTSDQDGTANMELAADDYVIELGAIKTFARVVTGAQRQVQITIEDPRATIRGTVVDAAYLPVAGAIVSFERDITRFARTAADGTFALAGGGTSAYVALVAYRIGQATHATGFGGPDAPVTLVLGGAGSIAGTVVRNDGSQPDRFEVIVRSPLAASSPAIGRTTRTFLHTRGAFLLDGLPAGAFQLGAAINGVETWMEVVLAPDQQLTGIALTIPPIATITGRVVDADTRAPIADARLNLRCDRNGEPLAFTHADQVSGADGAFEIRDLPPGACSIEIAPPPSHVRANQQVTVPDRGIGHIGELALARARR